MLKSKGREKMYLECVVVCVNYSDFLRHTLPYNKNLFNRIIVVTDSKDLETKKVCEYYHVECIQTDVFYENGDSFNKAKGINAGLSKLSKNDWVVHMDADIYLPPLTRTILDNISEQLDRKTIYGVDRLMCPSYEDWIKYLRDLPPVQEGWIYIHGNSFPIGVRIAEYMNKNSGWEPIGYFQMWNPKQSGVMSYPENHQFADRTDVLHAKKFTRSKRSLIPELYCIHLDSEGLGVSQMGKNWRGRKTALFGPSENNPNIVENPQDKPQLPRIKRYFNWSLLKLKGIIAILIIVIISMIIAMFCSRNVSISEKSIPIIQRDTVYIDSCYKPAIIAPILQSRSIQYVVKYGDTCSDIANEFYGDWRLFTKIREDNNLSQDCKIVTGQILVLNF